MAVELLQSRDCPVSYVPTVRPASAELVLVDDSGAEVASPAVTVDAIGAGGTATIASLTNQATFEVDDATNIRPGQRLWLQPQSGSGSVVKVSTVSGTTVTVDGAPAATVLEGDTLHGATLRATVSASALGMRGLHWSLRWTITDADGRVTVEQETAHVVRQRFRDACTPDEVSRYVGQLFPGMTRGRDAGWYADLAERASDRVRRLLQAKGCYPHLAGDPLAFREAGRLALLAELALQGQRAPGYQGVALEDIDKAARRAVYEAADGLQWHDRNDDGAVQASEVAKPVARVVRLRR